MAGKALKSVLKVPNMGEKGCNNLHRVLVPPPLVVFRKEDRTQNFPGRKGETTEEGAAGSSGQKKERFILDSFGLSRKKERNPKRRALFASR